MPMCAPGGLFLENGSEEPAAMTESHALQQTESTLPEGSVATPVVQDDRPCLLEAGESPSVRRLVFRHEETAVGPALIRWHRDGKLARATIEPLVPSDRVTVGGKVLEGQTELTEGITVTLGDRSYRFFLNGDIHHLLTDDSYAAAARDPITGCLNRETLLDRLAEVYADAREAIAPLSLVTFDLAEHQAIRDQLSRADRDKVYHQMVDVVGQRLRQRDLLFRAREHVFMLVLPHTRSDLLEGLCARIQQQAQELRLDVDGAPSDVTVRVQVTTGPLPRADQDHTHLLDEAEAALESNPPASEAGEG